MEQFRFAPSSGFSNLPEFQASSAQTRAPLTGVVGGELITPSPPSFHLRFGVQCLHRFGVRMPTAANCVVANANSLLCWKLGTEAAVGDGGQLCGGKCKFFAQIPAVSISWNLEGKVWRW
eukprot:Gb_17339 [translate_table: standard]